MYFLQEKPITFIIQDIIHDNGETEADTVLGEMWFCLNFGILLVWLFMTKVVFIADNVAHDKDKIYTSW